MYKDEIDYKKGIAHLAGKKEIYIRIANVFITSGEEKIKDLKEFFANGDFERLTIEFHGLKSSAASVGSTLLPEVSIELEAAGKRGDNEFIKERFDAFIEQYEDTCKALGQVIEQL